MAVVETNGTATTTTIDDQHLWNAMAFRRNAEACGRNAKAFRSTSMFVYELVSWEGRRGPRPGLPRHRPPRWSAPC